MTHDAVTIDRGPGARRSRRSGSGVLLSWASSPLPSVGDRPASSTDTKSGHPVSASFLRAKWLTRQFIRGTRSTADPPRDEPVDHSESIGQICLSAPFRRGCAYCQQPTLWWAMSQFFWLTRPPSLFFDSGERADVNRRGSLVSVLTCVYAGLAAIPTEAGIPQMRQRHSPAGHFQRVNTGSAGCSTFSRNRQLFAAYAGQGIGVLGR